MLPQSEVTLSQFSANGGNLTTNLLSGRYFWTEEKPEYCSGEVDLALCSSSSKEGGGVIKVARKLRWKIYRYIAQTHVAESSELYEEYKIDWRLIGFKYVLNLASKVISYPNLGAHSTTHIFTYMEVCSQVWPCTEPRKSLGTWLREICSCSCLTFMPGPAWVLLSKICKDFFSALYVM